MPPFAIFLQLYQQEEKHITESVFLPIISTCDQVELCNVVHHGGLKWDLLHEHWWGGDVLDLSLQEHFICLEWRGQGSNLCLLLIVKYTSKISKADWATHGLYHYILSRVRLVHNALSYSLGDVRVMSKWHKLNSTWFAQCTFEDIVSSKCWPAEYTVGVAQVRHNFY